MTFGDLLTRTRKEVLVDQYADAFDDADIEDALWYASVEIAAAFDFPRAITTAAVAEAATSITVPSGARRVHTITIDGDDLRSVDLQQLLRSRIGTSRASRYYNFDPRRADSLLIAPASAGGTATIEYTATLTRPGTLSTADVWDGVLEPFHSLVMYRAAVTLFQMDERENEVQHWQNEYQARAAELTAFLNRSDMASAMMQADMRNDEGAAG